MNFPRPVITELHTYPIKSCAGLSHDQAVTSATGLNNDRKFALVGKDADGNNEVLTQRRNPELARVEIREVDNAYMVAIEGVEYPLHFDEEAVSEPERVELFDKLGKAEAVNQALACAAAELVRRDVRLMRLVTPRIIKPATFSNAQGAMNQTGFADGYPISMVSQASIDEVNRWLEEEEIEPVSADRLRINVFVDAFYDAQGNPVPFGEDYVRGLKLANVGATVVRAISRCVIPQVNQQLGERDEAGSYLNRVLLQHRRYTDIVNGKKGTFIGQHVVPNWTGQPIKVGDTVTVYNRASEPNITQHSR